MTDLPQHEYSPRATGKHAYRQRFMVELTVISFGASPQESEESAETQMELDTLQFGLFHVESATPLPDTQEAIPLLPGPSDGPHIAVQDYNFGGEYVEPVFVPVALVEALGSVEAAYAYLTGESTGNLHYEEGESAYVDAAGEEWNEEVPGAGED